MPVLHTGSRKVYGGSNPSSPTMVELILRLSDVSDDTVVYKPTGEKKYRVRRQINFYHSDSNAEKIPPIIAEKGVAFLVSDDGSVNVVPELTKVRVVFPIGDAIAYLQEMDESVD